MRLLLDTNVLIWWAREERLSTNAATAIETASDVFVSAVSIWEAELKASLGKLRLGRNLAAEAEQQGFEPLAVTFPHAVKAAHLPYHHSDPFDRMLVAQAMLEELTLVTRDSALESYGVAVIAA